MVAKQEEDAAVIDQAVSFLYEEIIFISDRDVRRHSRSFFPGSQDADSSTYRSRKAQFEEANIISSYYSQDVTTQQ
jgi:hypothetical protein